MLPRYVGTLGYKEALLQLAPIVQTDETRCLFLKVLFAVIGNL
jgi:hypothetical protein